jgi:hypothetical protein
MSDARTELHHELGASTALIDQLDPTEANDLLGLFRVAMADEAVALHHAVDETINGLPRLFRGPARKIVFPGGK